MRKNLLVFTVFAFIGLGIEVFFTAVFSGSWFGRSSIPMMPVYGLGGLLIDLINERQGVQLLKGKFKLWIQALIGVVIIYMVEYVAGLIIVKWAGIPAWDYTGYFLNVHGLITFSFAPGWYLAALAGIVVGDNLRRGKSVY